MKTVFISYDFNDASYAGTVKRWIENRCEVIMYREKKLHPQSDKEGQDTLRRLIRTCDTVVVLVGNNTHNRPWVDFEVQMAESMNKKMVVVRLPNTTGAAPYKLRSKQVVHFKEYNILSAIDM